MHSAVLPAAVPDRATDFFGLGRVDGVSLIGMLRVVFALRSGHFTAFGRTPVRFPPAPAFAVSQVEAAGIATRTDRNSAVEGKGVSSYVRCRSSQSHLKNNR